MKIGFVGLGRMGFNMVTRMIEGGHDIRYEVILIAGMFVGCLVQLIIFSLRKKRC